MRKEVALKILGAVIILFAGKLLETSVEAGMEDD